MKSNTAQPGLVTARYRAVVVGGSAGGLKALAEILSFIPQFFRPSILVVLHLHASDGGALARHLSRLTALPVIEPSDKEPIVPSHIYVAPADYHMLVERDETIALSLEDRVNHSRPSIDVLFETAASAWRQSVVAVILSGASADGARGVQAVKAAGGLAIAQDPGEAEHGFMPQAAIDTGAVDRVLRLSEIGPLLVCLGAMQIGAKG